MYDRHCKQCGERIDFRDFKEEENKKEFWANGLCQECQDENY